ncbi:MAG: hypothetical protein BIFFINMI_00815 [Phycisphaerae bacterium]|nr:hypothetical protein [Phycisphaerae bacterium]
MRSNSRADAPLLRRLLWVLPLLAVVGAVLAADAPRLILTDDIDQWQAEIYAGNPLVHKFVPGPRLETGLGGIVAFDSKGNGYVAAGTFIAQVTPDGQALLLTGQPELPGASDGPPGRATFGDALDIAVADDDTLYVVDAANLTLRRIRRTSGVWLTTTVAGQAGVNGHRDGAGRDALFTSVFDSVALDSDGTLYLFDGDWLRRYDPAKDLVTTLNPQGGTGYANGPLAQARFAHSQGRQHGMTCDGKGNLYVADKVNAAIRKVDLAKGEVSTFAGRLPDTPRDRSCDGALLEARFHPGGGPNMIFYNKPLDCFICRSDDETVIRIIKGDQVRTFGPGFGKNTAMTGPWKDCVGGVPCGIDAAGNVYVLGGGCIRVIKKGARP